MTTATRPDASPPDATPTAAGQVGPLVLHRRLRATPGRVFDAWTRPELMSRWMSPGEMTVEKVEADLRVGGAYRIVMLGTSGERHTPEGVYLEIDPARRLVFTWRWAGTELETRVTVEMTPAGDAETDLTVTHEGFADAPMLGEHQEGWNGCLVKLPAVVARPSTRKSSVLLTSGIVSSL